MQSSERIIDSQHPTEKQIAETIKQLGFNNVVYTSCSIYQGIEAILRETPDEVNMIKLAHEHGVAGVAGGLVLGGKKAIGMIQNSGLFNAGDGYHTFASRNVNNVPILLLASLRRDKESEPHFETGKITDKLTRIIFGDDAVFGNEDGSNFLEELRKANQMIEQHHRTAVIRMPQEAFIKTPRDPLPQKGTIVDVRQIENREAEISNLKGTNTPNNPFYEFSEFSKERKILTKQQAIKRVYEHYKEIDPQVRLIVGNGFNARDALRLYPNHPNILLVPGYMGGAPCIGIGLELARPDVLKVVIIGNENWDMAMASALKIIKTERMQNLRIVVLHDHVGSSVGGAPSTPDTLDNYNFTQTISVYPDNYSKFVKNIPRVEGSPILTRQFQEALAAIPRRKDNTIP